MGLGFRPWGLGYWGLGFRVISLALKFQVGSIEIVQLLLDARADHDKVWLLGFLRASKRFYNKRSEDAYCCFEVSF